MQHPLVESGAKILVVQPDPGLLADLERVLAGRYGPAALATAASSHEALELLEGPSFTAAVAVAELRLPEGPGTGLLELLRERFPDVGRVLMGAAYVSRPEHYDESELMLRALDTGIAQSLVTRPWTPAADRLFPVLDDQIDDWLLRQVRRVQTITVVSDETSARGHELRDVLARNGMAHEWFDASSARGRALTRRAGELVPGKPVVLLHNGAALVDPTNREVADALGVLTRAPKELWDLIIVGAGPAGLAAAVYGASEGLSTLGIEAEAFGGQAGTSSRIENYLGFPSGISGGSLMQRAGWQAGRLGAQALIPQRAVALEGDGRLLTVTLEDRQRLRAPVVVLATGVRYRRLQADDIDRYVGAGVYYGSPTVELNRVKAGDVYVVGAGNSAGQAAVRLSENARSVTLVVRGDSLEAGMSHYLVQQLRQCDNVQVMTRTEVVACRGTADLEEIVLAHDGVERPVRADALFVMIGAVPNTDWLPQEVARDEHGFVLTGPDLARHGVRPASWPYDRQPFLMETALPHLFAVGDVRHGSIKRVASAVGEGSAVVSFAHEARRELVGDPARSRGR